MSRRLPRVGLQWIIPLRRGTSCLLDLGACRTPQRTVWPCPAWHRHSNDPPSLTHPSHTHTSETGNPELFFFPSPDSTPLTDRTSWHTQEQIQIKIITFAAAGSSSQFTPQQNDHECLGVPQFWQKSQMFFDSSFSVVMIRWFYLGCKSMFRPKTVQRRIKMAQGAFVCVSGTSETINDSGRRLRNRSNLNWNTAQHNVTALKAYCLDEYEQKYDLYNTELTSYQILNEAEPDSDSSLLFFPPAVSGLIQINSAQSEAESQGSGTV